MFDISWGEMLVVGIVALVVIGPKELPGVIRSVGKAAGKLRTMAGEFRGQWDEAMRETELHEVKKDFDDLKNTATGLATSTFDPIRSELRETVDGAKNAAVDATGGKSVSETLSSVEADAKALEEEVRINASIASTPLPPDVPMPVIETPAVEPETAPKPKRRKKPAEGDNA